MLENGVKSNRVNHVVAADAIVRNDEVVGSIPTSSTKFSSTCKPSIVQPCHTLSQKIWLGARGVRLKQTSRSARSAGRLIDATLLSGVLAGIDFAGSRADDATSESMSKTVSESNSEVVVATLDAAKAYQLSSAIPQNVNYAIKADYLLSLVAMTAFSPEKAASCAAIITAW